MSKELKRHSVRGVKYNGEEICGGFAYYDADDVDSLLAKKDAEIAELKNKCQMHDFFWEGCGLAKRGFKNTITVSEAFDRLEAENAELKKKLMPCLNGDCILTCEVVEKYGKENAELKAELDEKDKDIAYWREEYDKETQLTDALKDEIESLKASHYAESVDEGMENRKLKRALWFTRALRARDIQRWWIAVTCSKTTERACIVWNNVERKCRAKVEEFR